MLQNAIIKNYFYSISVSVLLAVSAISQAAVVVELSVLKNGKLLQKGIATQIANETLLSSLTFTAQGDQIQVKDRESGAVLLANIQAEDKDKDLVLLTVPGLNGQSVSLAKEEVEPGRKTYLLLVNGEEKEGLLHSLVSKTEKYDYSLYQHTVPVPADNFSAPLLNNCRELIGISKHARQSTFNTRLVIDENFGQAVTLSSIKGFLESAGVAVKQAPEICLSEKQKLENIEKALKKQEQEKKAIEDELSKLKKQKEILAQEKDAVVEEKNKIEEEKQKELEIVEEDRKQTEQDLQKEKVRSEQEAEKARQKEAEAKKIEEQARREKEQDTKTIKTVAGIALFVLIIVMVVLIYRKKQIDKATSEKNVANQALSLEKARLQAAQEELQEATQTFHDLVFVGLTEEGQEQRVKIVGNVLARSPNGVLLGRSAQNASFVLNVPSVSREHLRIRLEGENVYVEDLKSFNGSKINGQTMEPGKEYSLNNGDDLVIGTVNGKIHFLKED